MIREGGSYGMIDKDGKVIIPLIYDHLTNFSGGFAIYKQLDRFGYLSLKGYHELQLSEDEESLMEQLQLRYQVYDLPPVFDSAGHFRAGRAIVTVDDIKYMIDAEGKVIMSFEPTEE